MKTKYLKNTWMHLTLAGSLLGMLATAAQAESFSVEVPFAFEAAGRSFPAGGYTLDSITSGVLVIRGAGSADTAAIMVSPSEQTSTTKSSVVFDKSLDRAVLSTVKLSSGLTLTVIPPKHLTATLLLPAKGSVVLTHP